MKFHLAINLERQSSSQDMQEVANHIIEMVKMADRGGFKIVWSAEHHALEMTIAPDPFQLLTWWATHTENIRLGTAVVAAPYWHPIKLAGEAAMTDLISKGRLEFGIGSGAYQREFDRMYPGLKQTDGWRYMHETLPAVKSLWQGDYEHNGEFWSFPLSTSVPKPIQKPHPPIWVAARAPITYDFAVENECNIMSWPLTRPMSEAELYKSRLDEALIKFPSKPRPIFSMMRHTAVYEKEEEWETPVKALTIVLGQFENLFKNLGDVENGFTKLIELKDLENREQYNPEMLRSNLMFGTPDQVIEKLKLYQNIGVDEFIYYATFGLGLKEQKKSLELFINEVMPEFS